MSAAPAEDRPAGPDGPPSTPDAAVEQCLAGELALLRPEVRRSGPAVDALLHPDFVEIGASGRLWSRPEMIAALTGEPGPNATTEQLGHDSATAIRAWSMVGRRLAADLVLIGYQTAAGGRIARRTSLWQQTGAGWRLLHHQGTLCDRVQDQEQKETPIVGRPTIA